jgi:hypothetical protein
MNAVTTCSSSLDARRYITRETQYRYKSSAATKDISLRCIVGILDHKAADRRLHSAHSMLLIRGKKRSKIC